ncbi:uncharacterized protein VTP21DRAFT_1120 [Calcarisporiella thermophila]|uniref:uncharacterized protein n=1 Tax=Calcarisporiella thermophila TaxID=911321 RepID=UPI003742D6C7
MLLLRYPPTSISDSWWALGTRYHLISPDFPGFGNNDTPDPTHFSYCFYKLADFTEGFGQTLKLNRFVKYVFDYGAPLIFHLATCHPEWIAGLVVQNDNA